MPTPLTLTWACLCAVAAGLVADGLGAFAGKVLGKLVASTCFVALAVALGALDTPYGRLILAALALGWLGDALLLSRRTGPFMGGLVAFLLAHGLFAAAFASAALSVPVAAVALAVAIVFGRWVLRWLLPRVPRALRPPVVAYVVVILVMVVAAAGHAAATGRWLVLAGAVAFALSDLAVARDRFVQAGFVNRLWGWPAYFGAQLVLAWSVAGAGAPVGLP